jgi:hypothetical protein
MLMKIFYFSCLGIKFLKCSRLSSVINENHLLLLCMSILESGTDTELQVSITSNNT